MFGTHYHKNENSLEKAHFIGLYHNYITMHSANNIKKQFSLNGFQKILYT